MGRIIFLCPFAANEITGGIKTLYRHAELLTELGLSAQVFQPAGPPNWFHTKAAHVTALAPVEGDVLVFPEVLSGTLAELAEARLKVTRVLFCQAHYYTLFNTIAANRYRTLGFERYACQSTIAKGFLERVLRLENVAILPCPIDTGLFIPRDKTMQIAVIPRKLPREAAAIQRIFGLKYPHLVRVPWQVIEGKSEQETAEIFGRSSIVLSLPYLESFGLVALEAMASGAIVAGFHGYGGQEYTTTENGFWFPPDHLEEVADALARIVVGIENGDKDILKMRDAGFATAARYSVARTSSELRAFYGPLLAGKENP